MGKAVLGIRHAVRRKPIKASASMNGLPVDDVCHEISVIVVNQFGVGRMAPTALAGLAASAFELALTWENQAANPQAWNTSTTQRGP